MTDIQPLLITLSTVCTVLMIGLGFLPYPSRESAIWASAFVAVMVATYFDTAAGALGGVWPRVIAESLNIAGLGLVWVGVRVRVGRRWVLLVPTIITAALLGAALLLSAGTPAQPFVVTVGLFLTALVAAAIAIELFAVRTAQRVVTVPLTVAASLISVFAVIWFVASVLQQGIVGVGRLVMAQQYAPTAAVVIMVTALVTLLLLVRNDTPATTSESATGFRAIALDRLSRAERFDDAWWSVLDVRLDDPIALREASSALAYTRVLDRFASDVSAVFPAEADLHRVEPTRIIVLLPRHEAAVRPLLRALLERVATVSSDQSIDVRLSASIGWASVSLLGYDLDDLLAAASTAADEAQLSGGDRWERASIIL